ncbi:unnamed protein product [Closterium sp. Yama58-4]|nr:unnamed protein product [Closterium sp. Yama58-4]
MARGSTRLAALALPPLLLVLLIATRAAAVEQYGVWDSKFTGTLSLIQGEDGGSCGYGKTNGVRPYNLPTIAISSKLYENGTGCGACYAVQCVKSQMCRQDKIVAVTATSECIGQPRSGICRPGKKGIIMSPWVYDQIVKNRVAGNIRVRLARIPCKRRGGLVFKPVMGTDYFIGVLIMNAAGPGGIASVHMKVGGAGWLPMARNFGGVWSASGVKVIGVPISFHVVSAIKKFSITALNILPATWRVNGTYVFPKNFPLTA